MSVSASGTALATTFYPGVEPFLGEWFQSVEGQTDQEFDTWIALDGLSEEEAVAAMGGCPKRVIWIHGEAGDSPGTMRQKLLAPACAANDFLVLVDSDDILHQERVSAARYLLQEYEMAGCGLRLVDAVGGDLGKTVTLQADDSPEALLPRWNVFGLSNTCWHARLLSRCLPVPEQVEIVDWYLATRAWLFGAKIGFDVTPRMDYRQYGANMTQIQGPFDPARIKLDCGRVMAHFRRVLISRKDDADPERETILAHSVQDVERFERDIVRDPERLQIYTEELNKLDLPMVWWATVAHPKLQYLWCNK